MRNLVTISVFATLLCACGAQEQNADTSTQASDSMANSRIAVEWDSIFGVVSMRNDTICMETNSQRTPASGNFLIVLPDSGSSIPARIEGRLPFCPDRQAIATTETSYYRVTADGFTGLGIAVLMDSLQASAGGRIDIDRDGTLESYRTCASMEGIHLTAWAGEPLRSRRLWRYYYYLGYDLEPTCTEADYGT